MTKAKTYRAASNENQASYCRRHRLSVGTRLVGDEGYGPTVIRITALGERSILAVVESRRGEPVRESEGEWTLSARDWKRVVNKAGREQ